MADLSPQQDLTTAKQRLKTETDNNEIHPDDCEAIMEFLDAMDESKTNVHPGFDTDGQKLNTITTSSLASYCQRLTLEATRTEIPLVEMDADAVNEHCQSLFDGTNSSVKDSGLSQNTVSNTQATFRKFYEWAEFGPEKEELVMLSSEKTSVDERDMFTKADVEALREACDHPRDRALLEMLIYCGQRINALLTLRIKDIPKTEDGSLEGVFYLNPEVGGLKGADENGNKRPLLGAKKHVRDWLEYHPAKNDPDAALFCAKRASRGSDIEPIDQSVVHRLLSQLGERAGVSAPTNAHNFRHYWVTLMKVEYGLADDEIKHIGGWAKGSTVMDTTYSHLSDDDVIQSVEEKMGLREPEGESPLTPSVCPTCGEPVGGSDKACSNCGTLFSPQAVAAQQQVQQDIGAEKALASAEISDVEDELTEKDLEAIANDDAILAKLIEIRSENN